MFVSLAENISAAVVLNKTLTLPSIIDMSCNTQSSIGASVPSLNAETRVSVSFWVSIR